MWRSIQQLIDNFRRGRHVQRAEAARTARLGIETLESRTVLSANFGVDLESVAYHEFNAPPPPRILIQYEARAAFTADGSEQAAALFTGDRTPFQSQNDEAYATFISSHAGTRPPGGVAWLHYQWSQGDGFPGEQTSSSVDGVHPEDKVIGSSGSSEKGPQMSQSQTPADNDAGPNDAFQNSFASNFAPPRIPGLATLLERIAETRRVATSPFPTPIVTATPDDSSTIDAESLLTTYATLAASLEGDDDSSATSHDAAFDDYAPSRSAVAGTDEYMRLLAEDQTHDATADAGGFIELDEASIASGKRDSNLLADAQREAIESALRSLSARRGDAQATQLPENWLEQAWLAAETTQPSEATTDQIANEPGGMILLQPMAGDGDELIAASDMSEMVHTAVEMEATIGAFQAFDVSIDEASAALVKPAGANEVGSKQERDEAPNNSTVTRQSASGLGLLAIGTMAVAAKRRLDERRRSITPKKD